MNTIIENYYYIIIFVGLFIIFALVGYLVELIKKNREKLKEIKDNLINDKKIDDILKDEEKFEEKEELKKEIIINKDDELLNDYNNIKK